MAASKKTVSILPWKGPMPDDYGRLQKMQMYAEGQRKTFEMVEVKTADGLELQVTTYYGENPHGTTATLNLAEARQLFEWMGSREWAHER